MPESTKPSRRPRAGKLDSVLTDCVYQIATGVWQPGRRLPPLRESLARWGVNEVTCFRAYRRLVEDGLVVSRDRDGYYVAESESVARLGGRQVDFRELYDWFAQGVQTRTAFSVLGAARAVLQMAAACADDCPECGFVECTPFQAAGHAAEITERFDVPCVPLTTDEVAHGRIPAGIRFLFTTPFHVAELTHGCMPPGIAIVPVAVVLAPALIRSLRRAAPRSYVVMALKESLARSAAADLASRVASDVTFRGRGVHPDELAAAVERDLSRQRGARRGVVLSPSLWSAAPERWRGSPYVRPMQYCIASSHWETVAAALGPPLRSSAPPQLDHSVSEHP